MSNIKWFDSKQIGIELPKKLLKVTGTRFAALLGLNTWSTPFKVWCEITRTYKEPFVDTIYTKAGKAIEPRQAKYMEQSYGMKLIRPVDRYGEDYFKKTWGDFFPEQPILGGSWDYLAVDENGKVDTVLEMKTTKRSEDWKDDVPEYYAQQAALYAYLLGVDNVIMVCSFLSPSDYDHPEAFVPSVKNTITVEFKVSERYPDFADKVKQVEKWWKQYVETGISPVYDEKKDADILAALRTNTVDTGTDIEALVSEAEYLKGIIDSHTAALTSKTKRLEEIQAILKAHATEQFRDGDARVEIKGSRYVWTVARSEKTTINKDALAKDGLLSKYETTKTEYRMTVKEKKNENE